MLAASTTRAVRSEILTLHICSPTAEFRLSLCGLFPLEGLSESPFFSSNAARMVREEL